LTWQSERRSVPVNVTVNARRSWLFGLGFGVFDNFFNCWRGRCHRRRNGDFSAKSFKLVFSHVFVHLAPTRIDGGFVDALVQGVAVFNAAQTMATGTTNGFGIGFTLGNLGVRPKPSMSHADSSKAVKRISKCLDMVK
jgi:hypothetical protein